MQSRPTGKNLDLPTQGTVSPPPWVHQGVIQQWSLNKTLLALEGVEFPLNQTQAPENFVLDYVAEVLQCPMFYWVMLQRSSNVQCFTGSCCRGPPMSNVLLGHVAEVLQCPMFYWVMLQRSSIVQCFAGSCCRGPPLSNVLLGHVAEVFHCPMFC
jgi:hypothetical protein